MKISALFLILAPFYLLSCSNIVPESDTQSNPQIGELVRFEGDASATLNNRSRNLSRGSVVYEGDLVQTGPATRLKIHMTDGAEIVLGDQTTLLIERYGFNKSTQEGQAVLQVKQGVFHNKSGKIAKKRPKHFRIKTAFASIGVKGTEFWGGFWESGKFDVALLKGKGVIISNQGGTVEITNIGWGSTLVDDTTAPTPPKLWSQAKLKKAFKTVSFKE
ncbi:MAG: FecR domain-containing protein [Deltaproteobacteria bacterium]|nr:FecR domain-containing protein [Deltaproteobacteria bacterium]MBT4091905.1 FecR domain-containing protein [Deltaproteobacteria bacterium]MBT4262664.1 FecR domain-containing protein [Deltaproteobacteria bacterium]MBT4643209.1 FecR domain-containing protein [Deltaproteobacteria bacterium]MBT6503748.1 FecR domain-containing protein [Deltaproteobacteria bacterium]